MRQGLSIFQRLEEVGLKLITGRNKVMGPLTRTVATETHSHFQNMKSSVIVLWIGLEKRKRIGFEMSFSYVLGTWQVLEPK